MFKLTIECSKDIKRLTLDFEDSTHSVTEFSDNTLKHTNEFVDTDQKLPQTKKSYLDRISQVDLPKIITKEPEKSTVQTSIPDVKDRPPLVDDGFNESL